MLARHHTRISTNCLPLGNPKSCHAPASWMWRGPDPRSIAFFQRNQGTIYPWGFSVLGLDSWGLWPINTHYIGDFPERYVGPTIPWTNLKVFIQNRSIWSWGKFSKVMAVAVVFWKKILIQKGGSPANSTGFANCSCPLFGVGLFAIHLNRAEDDGTARTSVFLLFSERKQYSCDIPCFSRQSRWSEIFLGSPWFTQLFAEP